jgi:hypothetical protein
MREVKIAMGRESVYELPLDKLIIDDRYQRTTSDARVAKMAKNFNPTQLGLLQVSMRADNVFAIVDGGHRAALLRKKGLTHALCQVHIGLTVEQEALLFSELNSKAVKPSGIRNFVALRFGGDRLVLDIHLICAGLGWKVADENKIGTLRSVTSLYAAHHAGNLMASLDLITRAWSTKIKLHDAVLGGVSLWLRRRAGEPGADNLLLDLLKGIDSKKIIKAVTQNRAIGGGMMPLYIANYFDAVLGFTPLTILPIIAERTTVRTTETVQETIAA